MQQVVVPCMGLRNARRKAPSPSSRNFRITPRVTLKRSNISPCLKSLEELGTSRWMGALKK
eukprot:3874651-Pyramimonas_sp.AAC.2